MGRKLDWLGGKFAATDNPLGSLIGWGLSGWNKDDLGGGSLLHGNGKTQASGFEPWEDDPVSPKKIPSGDDSFGNKEVLIRLISIENILRGMSELATESGRREIEEGEDDEQARERLERLAEQPKEPEISLSPTRVEDEEKKTGGLFGALAKFAGLIGPGSKLLLGIAGLTVAAVAVKKAWDFFNPDTSIVDAAKGAGKAFLGSALGDGPKVDTDAPLIDQAAAAAGDPVRSAIDAVERDVPLGVVATQSAQSGLNALRASGLGLRAPWHVGAAGWNAAAPVVGGGIRTATDWLTRSRLPNSIFPSGAVNPYATTAGTIPSMINQKTGKPFGVPGSGPVAEVPDSVEKKVKKSIWQRLMQSRLMQSRWMPNLPSLTRLRMLGRVPGAIGSTIQVGTGLWDLWQGNYGQAGTGGLAAGLMRAKHPLAIASGLTLSTALSDYKTQDESKQNVLGLLLGDQIGDLGRGGIGTGMMSDTLGAWLYRGESCLGSMMGGEEPEAAHGGGAVGRRHILRTKLMGAGYNSDQAEAIIENMKDESGFDEDAEGDYQTIGGEQRPTAFGIAQWRGDRATNMEAHVAAAGGSRFEGQVGFLIKELADYNLSPEQMPEDFAGAHNAVLLDYEKPAQKHAEERMIAEGTPAPGQAPTTPSLFSYARQTAGPGGLRTPTPTATPVEEIARGRTATAGVDSEEDGPLTPTAVVAPQTTNNFFDNRSTNVQLPPLDARNREAGVVALQNLQGLTPALG